MKSNKYFIHLQKDPILANLIRKYGKIPLEKKYNYLGSSYFDDLVTSIIGQLISMKASAKIRKRVSDLCENQISSERILKLSLDQLRAAGLSQNKANYLRNLAQAVKDNSLNLETIDKSTNEEIRVLLSKIKGIGNWTIEMFLIFSLHREDVFPYGDVVLRKAVNQLYGNGNNLTKAEIESIAVKWKPYRSYACLYLWQSNEKI
ncbi:MAG: hypothetical protein FWE36_02740 [Erysipelotrichales bacterium]|nr:hypothetical protein [Erysipelotrichales bacterium]